jgi:hypothetical protein
MRKVVLESPYAGDIEANVNYARRCVCDSLARGEAPLASHLLYTQPDILDDTKPEHRALGINAGHEWIGMAEAMVVYEDRGISSGMRIGIAVAEALNIKIEYRRID